MGEVVALVAGGAERRRAVLRRAGRYAGAGGAVHVVCDGSLTLKLAGVFALYGLTMDADFLERANFVRTADTLAPYACGWTWSHTVLGARTEAFGLAARLGAPLVLPARSALRRKSLAEESAIVVTV
ncbi:hypothetical protein [Nocardia goodfellowii]|uniref:Uncharacterized protein n=1 Tax=Nocardia goodfellowii TaxID=882446 RepID=A0ABS4QJU3_9NOCA|nr:hypothetical protein [Nocardia goodfellowii]MBP2191982.1 hypothetical protein [Nocardia goodfellowii]